MTELSIAILSFNTKDYLDRCLSSLSGAFHKHFEIIVIDNASTDGSPRMVAKKYPKARLVLNKTNTGFSAGNNQAAKIAKGKYLFFLNSDTVWEEGNLDGLIAMLTKGVGAASPLLLNEDGSVQADPCYLRFPSALRCFIYYNGPIKRIIARLAPQLLFARVSLRNIFESEQLPGAALLIKKELFEQIGGFDENLPIYFNDTDLSFAIRARNLKLLVNPEVKITHFGRKSIASLIKKGGVDDFYLLNFRSLFEFCQKNYSFSKMFLIKTVIFMNLLVRLKVNLISKLFLK